MLIAGPTKLKVVKPRTSVELGSGWRLSTEVALDSTKVRFSASEIIGSFDVVKERTAGVYSLELTLPDFVSQRPFVLHYDVSSSSDNLVDRIYLAPEDDIDDAPTFVDYAVSRGVSRRQIVCEAGFKAPFKFGFKLSSYAGSLKVRRVEIETLAGDKTGESGGTVALMDEAQVVARLPTADGAPLIHYLGKERGAPHGAPNQLFDAKWYRGQLLDPIPSGMSELEHYVRVGDGRGISPHPLFDPTWYRRQTNLPATVNALGHFLDEGVSAGYSPHPLFNAAWYLDGDRQKQFAAATKLILDSAKHPGDALNPAASDRQVGVSVASSAVSEWPSHNARSSESEDRVVVYTCLFGAYESLKEPLWSGASPSTRFIVFTDDPTLVSVGWEVCVIHDRLSSSRRTSRLPKILPHLYLPDHEISIYLDASLTLKDISPSTMASECLEDADVAIYKHHKRDCVYDELAICAELGIERPELISWYDSLYSSVGLQRRSGLFENTLIVRRNKPAVNAMNEAWWRNYKGERDQLSLMPAIAETGVQVQPIRAGRQVRNNKFVEFAKHHRPALPVKSPKIFVFIAYSPPSYKQDLGRTYNEYMRQLPDDAWAMFLDHDAMFCSDGWFSLASQYAESIQAQPAMLLGMTNRIGNPYQRVGPLHDSHRIDEHSALARVLESQDGDWSSNVAPLNSSSGVVMMLSRKTWEKYPFSHGFLKVDNRMHIALRDASVPIYMPRALYVYHFYRADGDLTHAVRLEDSPVASGSLEESGDRGLLVKTCVYDIDSGLDFAHYSELVSDDEWVVFIRADATFCDKSWYKSAHTAAEGGHFDFYVFPNNLTDIDAPKTDDVLAHRDYVNGTRSSEVKEARKVTERDLAAFLIRGRKLRTLLESGSNDVPSFVKSLQSTEQDIGRLGAGYVYCQRRDLRPSAGTRAKHKISRSISESRRVAILTLGFWPAQAGMELMIHNLASTLTLLGDAVTLFTPKPKKDFTEIDHDYILKRFSGEEGFYRDFATYHKSLPFDVLLVQGGFEAASMALRMKHAFGVPVVLRTHGEDIQIDEDTGYGYRRDPKKRDIIESNVRSVDANVVIGEHIRPIVLDIAPDSDVEIIHNGVDVHRFRPTASQFLRSRLGIDAHTKVLIMVGRNVKKKAFHLAVEAFAKVCAEVPDVVLVHVGKSGNGVDLRAHAEMFGVSERFFMLGELNYFDTPAAYSDADIFVFPSKVETFGNVTIEAMSAGLPCVEFDYGVNRSKIREGISGYIVPFGDVDSMAARVVELLLDEGKRRSFGQASRDFAVKQFAWERVAEKYRTIFRRVAHGRVYGGALPRTAIGRPPVSVGSISRSG